ncbi:hypothetical protein MASR2M17_13040 [Aminivibrio sp.]
MRRRRFPFWDPPGSFMVTVPSRVCTGIIPPRAASQGETFTEETRSYPSTENLGWGAMRRIR